MICGLDSSRKICTIFNKCFGIFNLLNDTYDIKMRFLYNNILQYGEFWVVWVSRLVGWWITSQLTEQARTKKY